MNNELQQIQAEKARRSIKDFAELTVQNYKAEWFHKVIFEHLEKLYAGEIKNLMIFVPPQCGKSTISSIIFPAWALGKNPDLKFAICSYASSLAKGFNRKTQSLIDSKQYNLVFPNTALNDSNVVTQAGKALRNSDVFEIVGRQGSYYSVGVGGGLTGKSVDIGIIDDPFKDRAEADSTTIRNKVWEWYVDVFLSRLPNSGRKLMLFTRWHEDDIAGRILASDQAKDWTVLKFEAIKETEDIPYDIRQKGEALWPEKHGLEKLLKTKELNPHTFSALYQQRPTAAEGGLFRRKWFEIISFAEFAQIAGEKVVKFFIDPAYTKKTSNDPTGFLASVYIRNTWYILNAHDAYIDSSELSDYIKQYTAKQGYTHKSVVYIEPKASGLTLTQLLRKNSGLNVLEYKFDKRSGISLSSDKYSRAASIVSVCAALRVVLVQGEWNQSFLNQLTTFPNASHDDLVDCLIMTIMESLYSDTTSTKDVLAALL